MTALSREDRAAEWVARVQRDVAASYGVDWKARAETAEARLAELENAVTRVLDSAYAETMRREEAETGRDKARAAAASDRGRVKAAEAENARLRAALRKHMPTLDEHGTPVCAGCLEPSPCPDTGLLAGGEAALSPSGMQDPAPVVRVIGSEEASHG